MVERRSVSMNRPIRIAYFDLGHSKEDYSLNPTKYGGGAVVGRYLKEESDIDFHIFAPAAAFDSIGRNERADRCHALPDNVCAALRSYHPLDCLIPAFQQIWNGELPDIILHGHTCESLNRGGLLSLLPVVHWSGFDGSAGHGWNDYILLYDDTFRAMHGEKPKYVRIGKPVPKEFKRHPKAGYVFQCSRHDNHLNSLEAAIACRRFGIPGYFAGPIHNGYPLMDQIDGKITHYLGEIDEATKLAYCRHASLFVLPLQWDAPFSQSVIEAQGEGTALWAYQRGPFLKKYLKPGINGFNAYQTSMLDAFNLVSTISQEACWREACQYDSSVMVSSFKQAFNEILHEWDK